MLQIKLQTPQDVCNKANKTDYGLSHKENKVNFLCVWTEKIKAFFVKIKL